MAALVLLAACGGSDPVTTDAAVAPFVGDWQADTLRLTSVANPDVHPDLIEVGAQFTLNVQPSGQYTAILLYAGQSQTEIGQVEVSGGSIILHRDFPKAGTSSSTYAFQGSDRFTMDGDTEFDFNLDGTSEPARGHIVFSRK